MSKGKVMIVVERSVWYVLKQSMGKPVVIMAHESTKSRRGEARAKANLLGGRGAALAGAEVVDVAHASLLQRHRRPARRDANDPPPPAALCAHIASKTGRTG